MLFRLIRNYPSNMNMVIDKKFKFYYGNFCKAKIRSSKEG